MSRTVQMARTVLRSGAKGQTNRQCNAFLHFLPAAVAFFFSRVCFSKNSYSISPPQPQMNIRSVRPTNRWTIEQEPFICPEKLQSRSGSCCVKAVGRCSERSLKVCLFLQKPQLLGADEEQSGRLSALLLVLFRACAPEVCIQRDTRADCCDRSIHF